MTITGRPDGATGAAYTAYVMDWIKSPKLKSAWEGYVKG
jgi:hypothetical protein